MDKWHSYPDEKPEMGEVDYYETKKFLVSDQYGHITIKNYYKNENGSEYFERTRLVPATNVYFWMELPESPVKDNEAVTKLNILKRQKSDLLKQIADLEKEIKGGKNDRV